jgi:hypothetical protein
MSQLPVGFQDLNRIVIKRCYDPLSFRRCRRFAIGNHGFTFGALDLQHPRLLQL